MNYLTISKNNKTPKTKFLKKKKVLLIAIIEFNCIEHRYIRYIIHIQFYSNGEAVIN